MGVSVPSLGTVTILLSSVVLSVVQVTQVHLSFVEVLPVVCVGLRCDNDGPVARGHESSVERIPLFLISVGLSDSVAGSSPFQLGNLCCLCDLLVQSQEGRRFWKV